MKILVSHRIDTLFIYACTRIETNIEKWEMRDTDRIRTRVDLANSAQQGLWKKRTTVDDDI